MSRIKTHLSYANVTATIALFIALGGGAYAATHLPPNSVGTKQLQNGAVSNSKLENNAVTSSKVKNRSLTGADINASTLGKVPSAAHADHVTGPEAWHEIGASGNPTFASNWTNADPPDEQTAAFYKDPFGVVHLKGIVTATSGAGAVIFTLPIGYRPPKGDLFPSYVHGGGSTYEQLGYLSVLASGDVRWNGTVPGSASLSSIQFRTP